MFELMFCSLLTILPDYLYRRYRQGKRFGKEITFFSVWYELRWGITACLMLTVAAAVSLWITPVFVIYAVLMIMGSWTIPLITSYLPHDPDGATELQQTRVFRGVVASLLALEHLYHLEHHLYPSVPHHHWPTLANGFSRSIQNRYSTNRCLTGMSTIWRLARKCCMNRSLRGRRSRPCWTSTRRPGQRSPTMPRARSSKASTDRRSSSQIAPA